jgi:undecaprenyl-diphosphatase
MAGTGTRPRWLRLVPFLLIPLAAPGGTANVRLPLADAVALGTVQGLTEFLPISSSTHLWLVESAIAPADKTPANVTLRKNYLVTLQLPSALAALVVFRRRVKQLLAGAVGRSPDGTRLLVRLLLAFLPAMAVGAAIGPLDIGGRVGGSFRGWALLGGGIYLLAVDRPCHRTGGDLETLTKGRALGIGLLQCFAFCPGVSRSLMTITGGMLGGLSTGAAVEFSFLLGAGTILAATAHTLFPMGAGQLGPLFCGTALCGYLLSFAGGLLGISFLLRWLRRRSLRIFAHYRILLGCALIIFSVGRKF